MSAKLNPKKLDHHITDTWSRIAHGRQINIMDIPKVFRAARATYAETADLAQVDATLQAQVALYCLPS